MSKQTKIYVDKFWELMDILLNAILFGLIGLEILTLQIAPVFIGRNRDSSSGCSPVFYL